MANPNETPEQVAKKLFIFTTVGIALYAAAVIIWIL